jgi:two-component system NarL family sensor kinase
VTAWRARDQDDAPAGGIDLLWLATLRAALVPVVLLGEQLVDHPVEHTRAFPYLLAAFGVWAAALLALRLAVRRGAVPPPAVLDRVEPFVDLAAIVALTYASGGPFSETAMAFFVLPVLAAARLRPRLTAGWALGAVVAYILLSVVHPTAGESQATARMISQVAYLAWIGLAATLVSSVLHRREAAIAKLAKQRGQLAAHALASEQRERRRLAELLHDESVQTLSLAHQELADYHRTGREASFERARSAIDETMAQIRGEIFELHPYVLDHAGLPAALRAIADRSAVRMGAEITVAVDPAGIGHHDELIVVLTRELLTNAAKHSGASHVAVTVAADHERIELEVRDDGVGFAPARREAALLDGHVGLASSEQRVRSAGGELIVTTVPGRGTTVQAVLPADG